MELINTGNTEIIRFTENQNNKLFCDMFVEIVKFDKKWKEKEGNFFYVQVGTRILRKVQLCAIEYFEYFVDVIDKNGMLLELSTGLMYPDMILYFDKHNIKEDTKIMILQFKTIDLDNMDKKFLFDKIDDRLLIPTDNINFDNLFIDK